MSFCPIACVDVSTTVHFSQPNNAYSIAEMLLVLHYPILLGLGRVETTESLRSNGVFQILTGLPAYLNPAGLRRFLRRSGQLGVIKFCRLIDRL